MAINDFHGNYFFLSNFYECPFWYKGKRWKTVEHAFQAAKCLDGADVDRVHAAETPGEAKRIGRKVTLIPGWNYKRVLVMQDCLRMKFLQNDDLMQKLLATDNEELVEGNTWHDNDWGDCSCPKCVNVTGKNMLGKLLMEIRDNYRNGNYLWVARNMKNSGEIIKHFKSRENAINWISTAPYEKGEWDGNPYEIHGYRLDVVLLE